MDEQPSFEETIAAGFMWVMRLFADYQKRIAGADPSDLMFGSTMFDSGGQLTSVDDGSGKPCWVMRPSDPSDANGDPLSPDYFVVGLDWPHIPTKRAPQAKAIEEPAETTKSTPAAASAGARPEHPIVPTNVVSHADDDGLADVFAVPTPHAVFNNTLSAMLDKVAENEEIQNQHAARGVALLDKARRFVESHSGVQIDPDVKPKAKSKAGWTDDTIFRRQFVRETACRLNITERAAEMRIHTGRLLVDDLPATFAAMTEGKISYRHATVIADQADCLPKEARGEFDKEIAPYARQTTSGKTDRRARKLREKMHPESITERHVRAVADRYVAVEPARDGMAYVTAYLPAPEAFAIENRLKMAAQAMKCPGQTKTQMQLRTDFFSDLLLNSDLAGGPGKGIVPTVLVSVPVLTLLGKSDEPGSLEGYGPIDPDTARRLAGKAKSFVRILTHPETGTVLSVGKTRYKVPKDMRLWLRLRDETCRGPCGCNTVALHCEVDHTVEWHAGGETKVENLAFLCTGCHDFKTYAGWELKQRGGGVLEWVSNLGTSKLTFPETVIGGMPPEVTEGGPTPEPAADPVPDPTGDARPDSPPDPDADSDELPF